MFDSKPRAIAAVSGCATTYITNGVWANKRGLVGVLVRNVQPQRNEITTNERRGTLPMHRDVDREGPAKATSKDLTSPTRHGTVVVVTAELVLYLTAHWCRYVLTYQLLERLERDTLLSSVCVRETIAYGHHRLVLVYDQLWQNGRTKGEFLHTGSLQTRWRLQLS